VGLEGWRTGRLEDEEERRRRTGEDRDRQRRRAPGHTLPRGIGGPYYICSHMLIEYTS
jgi:hypothetical protein